MRSGTVPGMRIESSVPVDAPPSTVWEVLTDVESWPGLTASMTSVVKQTPGPLRVGSVVLIRQPRLPRATWEVTELEEGRRFVWVSRNPGLVSTAVHEVAGPGPSSVLRLAIDQAGPLGWLFGRLAAGLSRRYVDLEAAGIKRKAEAAR